MNRKTKFDVFVQKAETLETEGKTEEAIKFCSCQLSCDLDVPENGVVDRNRFELRVGLVFLCE